MPIYNGIGLQQTTGMIFLQKLMWFGVIDEKKSNNWKEKNQRKKFRFVNQFIVEFSKGHVVECSGQRTVRLLYYKEVTKNFENLQEKACAEVTFFIKLQAGRLHLCQKRTRVQVLSSEFYEIFKNTYFPKHLRVAASNHSGFFKKSKDK